LPRANKIKYPVLLFLIPVAFAIWPAIAGALVASTTEGARVGYLPLNRSASPLSAQSLGVHATEPTGTPPLIWHGGPVMLSQEAFAIFWAPSGYTFPAGYEAAIETYLENVAADSGKPSNVYSVSAQYAGSNGRAAYVDSYGGSAVDTDAYPTTGTCPPYTAPTFNHVEYTACLSDAKIEAEVQSVRAAEGWPGGIGAEYYVVLPPHVGSCFGTTAGSVCFDEKFCAYHSFTLSSPKTIYANISYSPGDPIACGVGEYPNGHANGNVDDTLSSLSHEANESITDPELNAYFDNKGQENGDECRNTKFHEDYGPPLGGSEEEETLFNEAIGSGDYYLQQEWSNDIEDCAQRVGPAQPVITAPTSAEVEESVLFEGIDSIPGDGGIFGYEWEFGDGSEGEGGEITHSYSAPGTYTVTLTLTDDGGFTYAKTSQITVASPEEPPGGEEEPPGGGGSGGSGESSGGSAAGTLSSSSSSSSSSPFGPAPAPAAGVAVAGAKAVVRRGAAALRLTCSGGGPCAGVVKLLDHGVLGHAAFNLSAGATKVLKVRLAFGGLALLAKKAGGLKISLAGTGVRHRTLTLMAG
jgi:hypothetical protein